MGSEFAALGSEPCPTARILGQGSRGCSGEGAGRSASVRHGPGPVSAPSAGWAHRLHAQDIGGIPMARRVDDGKCHREFGAGGTLREATKLAWMGADCGPLTRGACRSHRTGSIPDARPVAHEDDRGLVARHLVATSGDILGPSTAARGECMPNQTRAGRDVTMLGYVRR